MSNKAESRLIYNSISTSERVASLGIVGALTFTWLITHCDSQGRITGNPTSLKAMLFPLFEGITPQKINTAIDRMKQENLVIQYTDDKGRQLIQVTDWWEWQTGLMFKGPSRFQAPIDWEDKITTRDEKGRFRPEKD